MENQNQSQQPIATQAPITPTPLQSASSTPQANVITPTAPVATEPSSQVKPRFSFPNLKSKFSSLPKNIRILVILVPVVLLLFVLMLATGLGSRVRRTILPTPTPSPTATPEIPEITNPSAYATDPELLGIGDKLTEFDKNLSQIELREDTIRPPTVDWDVTFTK